MGGKSGFFGIREEDLDLSVMDDAMTSFSGTREERMARVRTGVERRRKAKERLYPIYGDKWLLEYAREEGILSTESMQRKNINTLLYEGAPYLATDGGIPGGYDLYLDRAREVYGREYDTLIHHAPGDPRVVRLLLQDASRTGRMDELPDCLRSGNVMESSKKPKFGKRKGNK